MTTQASLTEKEIRNARHFWSAVCEGVDADLSFEEAQALEAKGLIEKLTKLPGRGRYAGRWEAYPSDLLIEAVQKSYDRDRLIEEIANRHLEMPVCTVTVDGHLIGEE